MRAWDLGRVGVKVHAHEESDPVNDIVMVVTEARPARSSEVDWYLTVEVVGGSIHRARATEVLAPNGVNTSVELVLEDARRLRVTSLVC